MASVHREARLTIRIEASLKGALLFRGVQGLTQMPGACSEEAGTHGESAVYNVISFDVNDSVNMVWVVLDAPGTRGAVSGPWGLRSGACPSSWWRPSRRSSRRWRGASAKTWCRRALVASIVEQCATRR